MEPLAALEEELLLLELDELDDELLLDLEADLERDRAGIFASVSSCTAVRKRLVSAVAACTGQDWYCCANG